MDLETSDNYTFAPKQIDPYEQPKLVSVSQTDLQTSNFFRSCNLCANGSVALTTDEERVIELYNLPSELNDSECTQFLTSRRFVQSENVLGTLWFPSAIPEDPPTFCFLASIKECPVKLLDATDGRLRASYRIVDHRERQIAPHSMAFNPVASKIYCGFQDAIEVFDLNYPGEGERIFTTPSKKSRSGLKGIISSLAFSPDYSGLYAAGTFSSSLALFAEDSKAEVVQFLGGAKGPITQVKFNPMKPHLVYATSRQTNSILGWDIRGDTSCPLQELYRSGLTNQRLHFDLDVYGTTLVTGDKDGFVSCFDMHGESPERPVLKYKAHGDAIAAAVFHPLEQKLVTVSGSRNFLSNEDDADSSSSSDSGSSSNSPVTHTWRGKRYPMSRDTSIKLWSFRSRETLEYPNQVESAEWTGEEI